MIPKIVLSGLFLMITLIDVWLEALNVSKAPVTVKRRERDRFESMNVTRLLVLSALALLLFVSEGDPSLSGLAVFAVGACVVHVMHEIVKEKRRRLLRKVLNVLSGRLVPALAMVAGLVLFFDSAARFGFVPTVALALATAALVYVLAFGVAFPRVFAGVPYKNPFDKRAEHIDKTLSEKTYVIVNRRIGIPPNAALTGIFSRGRILLSKRLLQALDSTEITAILAHEMAHAKLKHMRIRLALFVLLILLYVGMLYIAYIDAIPGFFALEDTVVSRGVVFYMTVSVVHFFLEWGLGAAVRAQENQADAFVRDQGLGAPLRSALKTLHALGADDAHHPAYARFKTTHPPLEKRIETLTDAPIPSHEKESR